MRYLLDTNIISDIAKPAPSESLLAWMGEQNDEGSCQPKRFASLIGSDSVAVWPSPTTLFDGSIAHLR